VHQILGGSSDALGELYGAFAGDVFEVAYRVLGSVPDAEDVRGDVFLGMSAALRSYDHGSTCGFVKWLERSTVRRAAARANRIESRREVPLGSVPARAAGHVPTIERLALERALEGLNPALRTVFLLKAVEGHAHREISAMLGISVAASKVRLHRARKELRLVLGGEVVGPVVEQR
jgi:RNA polymerase sigma-70 factor (ECF subfamily)